MIRTVEPTIDRTVTLARLQPVSPDNFTTSIPIKPVEAACQDVQMVVSPKRITNTPYSSFYLVRVFIWSPDVRSFAANFGPGSRVRWLTSLEQSLRQVMREIVALAKSASQGRARAESKPPGLDL